MERQQTRLGCSITELRVTFLEQIVSVGLDVCEDVWLSFTFLKTAVPTFMKHNAYIMLSDVLVQKPIEFGVNWSKWGLQVSRNLAETGSAFEQHPVTTVLSLI